jgi:hypothetical protein
MSQRARYILIVVVLALVILGGAAVIYFFGQRAGTQLTTGQQILSEDQLLAGTPVLDTTIPNGANLGTGDPNDPQTWFTWLGTGANFTCTATANGTKLDLAGAQSVYEQTPPTTVTIQTTCTNIDAVAHAMDMVPFTQQMWAWDRSTGPTAAECYDQDDVHNPSFFFWPPATTYSQAVSMAQKHWFTNVAGEQNCEFLSQVVQQEQRAYKSIQDYTADAAQTKRISFGAAGSPTATQTWSSTHTIDQCNFYQVDQIGAEVENGQQTGRLGVLMGAVFRSALPNAECPNQGSSGDVTLEIRAFVDADGNGQYSGPTEGLVYLGADYDLTDKTTGDEIDYATRCNNLGHLGGAGRDYCKIPPGTYTAKFNGTTTGLTGPLKSQYNAAGTNPVDVTVTTNGIVEWGYTGDAEFGNLQVRMWLEKEKDTTYCPPVACGGTDVSFPGQVVKVVDSAGKDWAGTSQCFDRDVTGGAGRLDCWQIPIGKYTVTVSNPDPAKYVGPIKVPEPNPAPGEVHNANGTETLNLTVVQAAFPLGLGNDVFTYYDFGYTDKQGPIVSGGLPKPCVIEKTVADASASNEGSPDNPKNTTSSEGEGLNFKLAYDCSAASTSTSGTPGPITSEPVGNITIADDYDEDLIILDTTTISNNGVHDSASGTITWTVLATKGELTYSAETADDLDPGEYSASNKVTLTRGTTIEDSDENFVTIRVEGLSTPTPSTPVRPAPSVPTSPSTPSDEITPETGVGATVAVLIFSLIAAALLTVAVIRRPSLKTTKK